MLQFPRRKIILTCFFFADANNARNSLVLPKMEVIGLSDDDSANDNASVISSVSGSTIYEDTREYIYQIPPPSLGG